MQPNITKARPRLQTKAKEEKHSSLLYVLDYSHTFISPLMSCPFQWIETRGHLPWRYMHELTYVGARILHLATSPFPACSPFLPHQLCNLHVLAMQMLNSPIYTPPLLLTSSSPQLIKHYLYITYTSIILGAMVKLTVLVALFAALIAVASAASYTTVVTTMVGDEGTNPSCQQEMQGMEMQHCMQWMMQRGGRYETETPFLRGATAVANQQEHLQMCCQELRNFSPECRCEAIRRMMRQQMEHGMEEEMQQMMRQKAESLPRMCGMRSPSQCRMRAIYF